MRLPRVYVCAPYTADTIPEEKANERSAEDAAIEVAKLDLIPRCPHTAFGLLTPTQMEYHDQIDIGREHIIRECYEILQECDAIYLHSGWKDSQGCRKEFRLAYNLGLIILDGKDALKAYADKFRPGGDSDA